MSRQTGLGDSEQTTTDMLLICGDSWEEWHDVMRALATESIASAPTCEEVTEGTWSVLEAERFHAADAMKEWHEIWFDDLNVDGVRGAMISTLVQSAMSDVDWHQVADYYITRVKDNA